MCYAHVQGLELGGRKAAQTIRVVPAIPLCSLLLTAAANMGAQWLPWQPRGPLAANTSAGLVTSQQTPSGKSGQMSATNGSNDPI